MPSLMWDFIIIILLLLFPFWGCLLFTVNHFTQENILEQTVRAQFDTYHILF